jgi:hypothetical protein
MVKKALVLVLGLAALILNPIAACSLFEPSFNFGAAEMRAAVEGTWTITAPATADHPAMEYTVRIAQGDAAARPDLASLGLVAPAAACGSRSFVRPAAACIDATRMPLDIQIVKGPSTQPSSGKMVVLGTSFKSAGLDLVVDGVALRGQVSPKGVVTELSRDAKMVRIGS